MRYITCLIIGAFLLGCSSSDSPNYPKRLERAMRALSEAVTPEERFYALNDAAVECFNSGHLEEAKAYSDELITLLPNFRGNWNYGNAVQDANLVLGRIALRAGRLNDAKRYLSESGKSPGSPQMDTFGPDMNLANDLIEYGEREAVLEYFELCRKFWKNEGGKLDEWSQDVRKGNMPNFGGCLL